MLRVVNQQLKDNPASLSPEVLYKIIRNLFHQARTSSDKSEIAMCSKSIVAIWRMTKSEVSQQTFWSAGIVVRTLIQFDGQIAYQKQGLDMFDTMSSLYRSQKLWVQKDNSTMDYTAIEVVGYHLRRGDLRAAWDAAALVNDITVPVMNGKFIQLIQRSLSDLNYMEIATSMVSKLSFNVDSDCSGLLRMCTKLTRQIDTDYLHGRSAGAVSKIKSLNKFTDAVIKQAILNNVKIPAYTVLDHLLVQTSFQLNHGSITLVQAAKQVDKLITLGLKPADQQFRHISGLVALVEHTTPDLVRHHCTTIRALAVATKYPYLKQKRPQLQQHNLKLKRAIYQQFDEMIRTLPEPIEPNNDYSNVNACQLGQSFSFINKHHIMYSMWNQMSKIYWNNDLQIPVQQVSDLQDLKLLAFTQDCFKNGLCLEHLPFLSLVIDSLGFDKSPYLVQFYNEAREKEQHMTLNIYNSFIEAFGRLNDADNVVRVFADLDARGMKPEKKTILSIPINFPVNSGKYKHLKTTLSARFPGYF